MSEVMHFLFLAFLIVGATGCTEAPSPLVREGPISSPEVERDSAFVVSGRSYQVTIREYDVEGTVESLWVGDGTEYLHVYNDRAADVAVLRGSEILFTRTLTKEDFAHVSGADFVETATLHFVWFRGFDADSETARLAAGVYQPDTDVGDFVLVELSSDGLRMEVQPPGEMH